MGKLNANVSSLREEATKFIHSDVCCPVQIVTFGDSRYLSSHFKAVSYLYNKFEMAAKVTKLVTFAEPRPATTSRYFAVTTAESTSHVK